MGQQETPEVRMLEAVGSLVHKPQREAVNGPTKALVSGGQ